MDLRNFVCRYGNYEWRCSCNICCWPSVWRAFRSPHRSHRTTRLRWTGLVAWRSSSAEGAAPYDSTAICRDVRPRTVTGNRRKRIEIGNGGRQDLARSVCRLDASRKWIRRQPRSEVTTASGNQKTSTLLSTPKCKSLHQSSVYCFSSSIITETESSRKSVIILIAYNVRTKQIQIKSGNATKSHSTSSETIHGSTVDIQFPVVVHCKTTISHRVRHTAVFGQ